MHQGKCGGDDILDALSRWQAADANGTGRDANGAEDADLSELSPHITPGGDGAARARSGLERKRRQAEACDGEAAVSHLHEVLECGLVPATWNQGR